MTVITAPPLRLATAAMGTRFELVLYGDDDVQLRSAGECALAEIERLHTQLTRFSNDSLLTHINRTAGSEPLRLDADTFALFQDAQTVYRESAGAFDCTLGTGMDRVLLDRDACSIAFARHGSGIVDRGSGSYDNPGSPIRDPRSPSLRFPIPDPRSSIHDPRSTIPDPRLDLGAIAKGHALDRAAEVLIDNGVTRALLHGGTSSVFALGVPPGESAWRIALANHPQRMTIDLCNGALSLSCTLGDRNHNVGHVVDPRGHGSGTSGQKSPGRDQASQLMGQASVDYRGIQQERYCAVVGPSARLADAWSTALIVLGQRPMTLGAAWQSWLW